MTMDPKTLAAIKSELHALSVQIQRASDEVTHAGNTRGMDGWSSAYDLRRGELLHLIERRNAKAWELVALAWPEVRAQGMQEQQAA